MRKPVRFIALESKGFPDRYGIICAECPKCEGFIPNVEYGKEVTCPNCQHKFKVIK